MKDVGLLILRIGTSALMLPHGWKKLMKIFDGNFKFGDPIGIGEMPSLFLVTFAEFLCCLLILIGFRTRLATIPPIITMAVAGLIHHMNDSMAEKELPLLFLTCFLVIALLGPGKYSADRE